MCVCISLSLSLSCSLSISCSLSPPFFRSLTLLEGQHTCDMIANEEGHITTHERTRTGSLLPHSAAGAKEGNRRRLLPLSGGGMLLWMGRVRPRCAFLLFRKRPALNLQILNACSIPTGHALACVHIRKVVCHVCLVYTFTCMPNIRLRACQVHACACVLCLRVEKDAE